MTKVYAVIEHRNFLADTLGCNDFLCGVFSSMEKAQEEIDRMINIVLECSKKNYSHSMFWKVSPTRIEYEFGDSIEYETVVRTVDEPW